MESHLIVKKFLHKVGLDVNRYDKRTHPMARRMSLLAAHRIGVVFDVGANEGQYAREMRAMGYAGKLVSFEPVKRPFTELKRRADRDPLWTAVNVGLGDKDGTAVINVAANSYSSSILGMLATHEKSAPESRYAGTEEIQVRRLDSIFDDYAGRDDRMFLKIDTQGYEKFVLDGAKGRMDRVLGVQLELSLVPLYREQTLLPDLVKYMEAMGFILMSLETGFSDPDSGQLLQVDGVFFRGGK